MGWPVSALATISVPLSKQILWPHSALRCHVLGKVQWSETLEYKLEVVSHDQPSGPASTRPGSQAGRELAELVERCERSPVISRWWLSSQAMVEGVGSGVELCNTSRWFGVAVRCVLLS